MKKIIYIATLLFVANICLGQITIKESDFAQAGDWFRFSNALNILSIDPTETGANYTWDYSGLDFVTQYVDTFIKVDETPALHQLYFKSFIDPDKATNAQPASSGGNTFGGFELGNYYDFYRLTSSEYMYLGFGASISGIDVPMKYTDKDIIYKLPISYGQTFSDNSYLETPALLSSLFFYASEKSRSVEVDGWGSLTTPFGTFKCLRVKSVVNTKDSIYVDSLGNGFGIDNLTTVQYQWLGQNSGLPLLQIDAQVIIGDTIVTSVVYQDSLRSHNPPNSIATSNLTYSSLYPNPTSGSALLHIVLKKESVVSVKLLDIQGKELTVISNNLRFREGRHYVPISQNYLSEKGIYFIEVDIDNQRFNYKLLKQ